MIGCCFFACGCSGGDEQPTPQTSKRFLRLRGYEFNEKSFFSAAAKSDLIAVNGFLSAGINARVLLDKGADPLLKDLDGETAAGWAAKNKQGNIAMLLHEAEKSGGRRQ